MEVVVSEHNHNNNFQCPLLEMLCISIMPSNSKVLRQAVNFVTLKPEATTVAIFSKCDTTQQNHCRGCPRKRMYYIQVSSLSIYP